MISIDLRKASRQSAALARAAEMMHEQAGCVSDVASELRGLWAGEAADAYICKLRGFGAQLREDAQKCRESAAAFRSKIARIEAAEAEAVGIIAERRATAAREQGCDGSGGYEYGGDEFRGDEFRGDEIGGDVFGNNAVK